MSDDLRRIDERVWADVFGGSPPDEAARIAGVAVPGYTADIRNAWAVVGALAARGYEAQLRVQPAAVPSHRHLAFFLREVPGGGKWTPHRQYAAAAPTMPEAICRAALKAVAADDAPGDAT